MSVDFSNPWSNYVNSGGLHFLQVEQQCTAHGWAKRPGIIIWIGVIDILAAVCFMGLAMYELSENNILYPYGYAYFSLGIMAVVLRLIMGVFLLTGLRIDEDSKTLCHCRFWMASQLIFLIASIMDITSAAFLFFNNQSGKREIYVVFITVAILVYRVFSFGLMWAFTARLELSVRTAQQQGQGKADTGSSEQLNGRN